MIENNNYLNRNYLDHVQKENRRHSTPEVHYTRSTMRQPYLLESKKRKAENQKQNLKQEFLSMMIFEEPPPQQQRQKHQLNFEELHDPVIPFVLRKNYICKCVSHINCCETLDKLLICRNLSEMKSKYTDIKRSAIELQSKNESSLNYSKLPDVLIPHIENLEKIIKLNEISVVGISSLLHHTKSQYLTFWFYCELTNHIPNPERVSFEVKTFLGKHCGNLKEILQNSNFDFEGFINSCCWSKGANIIPVEYYAEFISVVFTTKKPKIFSKILFCFLLYLKNGIMNCRGGSIQKYFESHGKSEMVDWQSIFQAALNVDRFQ